MIEIELKTCLEAITKINDEFWLGLQKVVGTAYLKKEEIYAKEGDYVKTIGFLKSGMLRIYYLDENGNEWNKAFLEKNAFILTNINYEEKTRVYYEALTPAEILEVPISFFIDAMKSYPEIQIVYQKLLAELFERKSQREIDFLQLDAKKRFVKFKNEHPHFLKIIPQYHIASYLGITPTQLSRIKISLQNQQM